jgi:hypothetical protein
VSKTIIQFEFNTPAEATSFLVKLGGGPVATTPVATTPVATTPVAPTTMGNMFGGFAPPNAAPQNQHVLQNEFGLAKLGDCPPAIQANLLARLGQL